MKTLKRIAVVCAILLAFTLVALAQVTNGLPVGPAIPALKPDAVTLWNLLIVLVVPLVVLGVRKVTPVLPKITWPVLATLLGVAADWLLAKSGALPQSSWVLGALCGGAGIGLREGTRQVLALVGVQDTTTQVAAPAPTKPAGT